MRFNWFAAQQQIRTFKYQTKKNDRFSQKYRVEHDVRSP